MNWNTHSRSLNLADDRGTLFLSFDRKSERRLGALGSNVRGMSAAHITTSSGVASTSRRSAGRPVRLGWLSKLFDKWSVWRPGGCWRRYVYTLKTALRATAVQIVWSSRFGSQNIEHIGSAYDAETQALRPLPGTGWRQAGASGPQTRPGRGGSLEIVSSRMAFVWDALNRPPHGPRGAHRPAGTRNIPASGAGEDHRVDQQAGLAAGPGEAGASGAVESHAQPAAAGLGRRAVVAGAMSARRSKAAIRGSSLFPMAPPTTRSWIPVSGIRACTLAGVMHPATAIDGSPLVRLASATAATSSARSRCCSSTAICIITWLNERP